MRYVPRTIVDSFAEQYAGDRIGFSARQVTDYFTRYSNLVKPADHYGMNPTRRALFVESAYALTPKHQYYALNDLTYNVCESRYPYPSEPDRIRLRDMLHNYISPTPIGLSFSRISEPAFREDWVTCQSRIHANPPAAITAARTMLETLLKTIIVERGGVPDDAADLGRLLRQAEDVLHFERGEDQAEHQVFTGLTSVILGLSTIANAAGDRHGTVGGRSIEDPYFANLCVNAAGTIGVAFIEMHLLTGRGGERID